MTHGESKFVHYRELGGAKAESASINRRGSSRAPHPGQRATRSPWASSGRGASKNRREPRRSPSYPTAQRMARPHSHTSRI